MTRVIGDGDRRDFDEVRRLLYMALLVGETKRYNLAGTLVNALVHHHLVDDLGWRECADHIVPLCEGDDEDGAHAAWVHAQIARVTSELGD